MKYLFLLAAGSLLSGLPAWADGIRLKDGRIYEWKSISDEGDSYDVRTHQGDQVRIKKTDVDKFVVGTGAGLVLTGATIVFDRRKAVAVLACLERSVKENTLSGNWGVAGGVLSGSAPQPDTHYKIQVPYTPPEEYEFSFEATRREGEGDLMVGLVVAGRRLVVVFDHRKSQESGLALDGQGPHANETCKPGKLFQNAKPKAVRIAVFSDRVLVEVDGKPLLDWKVAPGRMGPPPSWEVRDPRNFFFGLSNSAWQVRNVVCSPKKD